MDAPAAPRGAAAASASDGVETASDGAGILSEGAGTVAERPRPLDARSGWPGRRHPTGRARRGGLGAVLALAALPWCWFAVRGLHPLMDLVAITLPLLVAALVVILTLASLLTRRMVVAVPVASTLVFGLVAVVLPWSPRPTGTPGEPVTILSANIAGPEAQGPAQRVVDSLLDGKADIVVVDELSPLVDRLLRLSFPYHAATFPDGEDDPAPPAVGVFTRLPILAALQAPDGLPGLRLTLAGPAGPFVLYAMHVPKAAVGGGDWATSFAGHDRLLAALARAAGAETLPVVVAGDLNTPDRSRGYRRLTATLRDAARTSWTGPTSVKSSLLWRLLALRIDHVLVARTWCADHASHTPLSGSDHRAVRVEIGPCASG